MRKIAVPLAAAALALGLTACGAGSGGGSDDDDTLVVGATAVPAGEVLDYIKKNLAEKEGLKLEVKEFTDY
ncbi:MetQ/NlpA family ABC transporter substrate-binding protein, partial [Streptomyces milbemycinicus]